MNWTPEELAARNREVLGIDRAPVPDSEQNTPQNKYRVAPKDERTIDGITFASKAEMMAFQNLALLQESGFVTKLELQPVFKFPMGFEYRADFRVTYASGDVEVIDVKGVETPVFKLKAKCMAHFFPEVKLLIW